MFYDRFIQVCTEKRVAPSRAAIEAGLSKSTVSKWKNEPNAEPSGTALKKLSEYFNMTIAELLGEDIYQKETAPTSLNKRDERDIEKRLAAALGDLEQASQADGLMFDGEPLDEETKELLAASLRSTLEMTKRLAKQKYTPKKYQKEGE